MVAQQARAATPTAIPLQTVDDVWAALRCGYGFPGDLEAFETDLQRALEGTTEADIKAVATVIVDYRGRIRLHQEPGFDTAVQEGIALTARLKRDASSR
ncbi:hypothetical protein [Streptomyces sp. NPDC017890]|uniref:hypothetical protein n=1 Tax=Streptomyces sp. NPDC017890 TaxID=3365015 RepID=UPI0037BC8C37